MRNKRADWYLKEYRRQWEDFLNERKEKWVRVSTPGGDSLGVYETFLSENVSLRIGTSITCGDKVCDYADASIKTYLFAVGGACAKVAPSTNKKYLQGILSSTKSTTGVKWRKRIDTWKKWVNKSINAGIKEYRSNAAQYERLAVNANLGCSGEKGDIGDNQREVMIVRATYFAMRELITSKKQRNDLFAMDWLERGLKKVEVIGKEIKKSGVPNLGAKNYISNIYKHKVFGNELLRLAKSWLRRQKQRYEFSGKLAANEFSKKAAKELLEAAKLMKEASSVASQCSRKLKEAAQIAKSAQPGFRDDLSLQIGALSEYMGVILGSSSGAEEIWQDLSSRIDQIGMGMYASSSRTAYGDEPSCEGGDYYGERYITALEGLEECHGESIRESKVEDAWELLQELSDEEDFEFADGMEEASSKYRLNSAEYELLKWYYDNE